MIRILWSLILLGSSLESLDASNVSNMILAASNPSVPNQIAAITLTITEISSTLSLETLTSLSPDICRVWGESGTTPNLTWQVESRLLVFSTTNIYEIYDTASVLTNFLPLKFVPKVLSLNSAGLSDSIGLAFYLSLNATPSCGANTLPKRGLCNDDNPVAINKTAVGSGGISSITASQSMCAQKFSFSYRYTYECSNLAYRPPSCKSTCSPIKNSTHCFACDEHDGNRMCCPGSSLPDCRNINYDPGSPYSEPSLTTGAIVAIVLLSLLCVFLLIACIVIARLLIMERENRPCLVEPIDDYNEAGWTSSNGASHNKHPKKNGTSRRTSSISPESPAATEQPVFIINKRPLSTTAPLHESDAAGSPPQSLTVLPAPAPRRHSHNRRSKRRDNRKDEPSHHQREEYPVEAPDVETIPKRRLSVEEDGREDGDEEEEAAYSRVIKSSRPKSAAPSRRGTTPTNGDVSTGTSANALTLRRENDNLGTLF